MRAAPSNGSSDLLQLVLTAAQEMSRHEDPAEVTRIALAHGRKILRFDRSLAATRRDMNAGTIRNTDSRKRNSDATGACNKRLRSTRPSRSWLRSSMI